MNKVRTRFAPSPTGSMHIGNLRTAFYAYALAKHNSGDFILRIEDTDKKREKVGGVDDIKRLLNIFNIKWDEYYVQSERLELYKKAAEKLVESGYAFYCQCEAKNAKEDGFSNVLRDPCRDKNFKTGAIKLKVPDHEGIGFVDYVLGKKVSWSTSVVGDTTLLKSDGFPTYHLAVVIDDHDMNITHALRGHDWMPSTPIHLLVYKYLGYDVPEIGHLTDIMDPDGGKLSKRKGSTSVDGLLNEGYLPEALFNYVILLGWAPKDNKELFSLDEFVKYFDNSGLQSSNPIFNREKLDWFNNYYYQKKYPQDVLKGVLTDNIFEKRYVSIDEISKKYPLAFDFSNFVSGASIYKNEPNFPAVAAGTSVFMPSRMSNIKDYDEMVDFLVKRPVVDKSLLGENSNKHIKAAIDVIHELKSWNIEILNTNLMKKIKDNNFKTGDFFMDLRVAIAGKRFTPPINESIVILGKEETLERLKKLI